MLRRQPAEYARFFRAFGFEEESIRAVLQARDKDIYSGIYWQGNLVGVSMLRGWDAGYEVPSYGIIIDDKYRGSTLLKICLDMAKLTCRLLGVRRLMAKIHPDNVSPVGASRLGFIQTGHEPETGNVIYHADL